MSLPAGRAGQRVAAAPRGQAEVLRGPGVHLLLLGLQPSEMSLQSSLCLAQVLFLLGTLVIAMSLQLDRRGIWNMLGPCLFAFVIMASMWVRSWAGWHCCPDARRREPGPLLWPHSRSCSNQ